MNKEEAVELILDYLDTLKIMHSEPEEDDEEGEVYLYRYSKDTNGQPKLENIESDEEYEIASDAFDELLDSMEYDELVSEDELN